MTDLLNTIGRFLLNLIHWVSDYLGLSQSEWLMVHAFIFLVTALVIWRQLRSVSRASSTENFTEINRILSRISLRELRRDIFTEAARLKKEGKDLNQMRDFLEARKQKVHQLILAFETMGIMVNNGDAIKKIMLDMYWDVIIKSWKSLSDFVWYERSKKIEEGTYCQAEKDCPYCKRSRLIFIKPKYLPKLTKSLLLYPLRLLAKRKRYTFRWYDFFPATCYARSHYENFEMLTKQAEWFAWRRGIAPPTLK